MSTQHNLDGLQKVILAVLFLCISGVSSADNLVAPRSAAKHGETVPVGQSHLGARDDQVGNPERSERVGVYSASMAGGRSGGELPICNTLKDASVQAESFANLSMESLLKYRVVIVPNCRRLSKDEVSAWTDNLRAYVTECGGSLIFYHISVGHKRSPFSRDVPLFPEIVEPLSVKRVETDNVRVETDPVLVSFPFLPGYTKNQVVKHMYYDHFAFTSLNGEVLLSDPDSGQAVVAVGKVGKGRVVFNGMFGGKETKIIVPYLEGVDKDILLNTVKWCLAGKGLTISSADKIKVKKWQPKLKGKKTKNKVVLLFGKDFENQLEFTKKNISGAGIDYDYIPLHFLPVRGLERDDYNLAIIFPQAGTGKDTINVIKSYLSGGGRAIILLPNHFSRASAVADLLSMMGCRVDNGFRGNLEKLRKIVFADPDHMPSQIGYYMDVEIGRDIVTPL